MQPIRYNRRSSMCAKIMLHIALTTFLLLAGTPQVSSAGERATSSSSLEVSPQTIEINATYKGTDLTVSGTCDSCDQVAIVLRGPKEEAEFECKGRVAMLWMNVARVTVTDVPEAYILFATDSLCVFCSRPLADSLCLGYEALAHRVAIEGNAPQKETVFSDYVKLKENKQLYQNHEGEGVSVTTSEDGTRHYTTTLFLPPTTVPGKYLITAYQIQDGKLAGQASANVTIEETGLPAYLTRLAYEHPALYGIIAVLVAMVTGMLMGLVFNRSSGAH